MRNSFKIVLAVIVVALSLAYLFPVQAEQYLMSAQIFNRIFDADTDSVNITIKTEEVTGDYTVGGDFTLTGAADFGDDITLENDATISNSTNGILTLTEPAIALAGDVSSTGTLDVQGGDITLENDEVIDNGTNGTVQIQSATALTNTVSPEFSLLHETSGVPANGIGTGISFVQETSAGNNEVGMSLDAVVTDATGASEDFKFSVQLMAAGAAKSEVFSVASTGDVTASGGADFGGSITLANDETISNGTNGQIDLNGNVYLNGAVKYKAACTIADGDATPDIAGCAFAITSANTGATEITDLDNPVVGSVVTLIGGSATNSSTITDGGNFNLSAGWTAGLDDILILYVQADNDYIEISRSDN